MAGPYDVFIKITAVDAFTPVLGIIGKELLKLEGGVKSLGAAWKAVAGGLAIFGGIEALKGVWDLTKGGKELLNQQDQLQRAGLSHLETINLTADAYERIAKAVPTAEVSEVLKTVRELRAVTGKDAAGLAAAVAQAPKSLQVDALLANTFGKDHQSGDYYKLLRSEEMKGIATDPKKREEFTDAAFSYITAFGGKLTASDYQTFARRGGAAFMNADVQKSMGPLSVLMADLGGQGAGTAAMTLQQLQVGAAVMSKQQAKVWEDAGLLDMSKVHKTGFGGGKMQLDPGALKGSLETIGNLPEWIEKYIRPGLMKLAGGDHNLYESYLGKAMPNRNAQKLAEMFGDPGFLDQIKKDMGLAGQVKTIPDAYQSYVNNNPVGVEKAYEAQKTSMLQAIGAPLMQAAIPVMKAITSLFEKIGAFSNANPAAITAITGVIAAIAGVAIIGGSLAILSAALAGFAALPVAAMVASAAALTGFSYIHWDDFRKGLAVAEDAFKKIPSVISAFVSNIAHTITNGLLAIPGLVSGTITAVFGTIAQFISSAIEKIKGIIPGMGGTGQLPRPGGHPGEAPGDNVMSGMVPPAKEQPIELNATFNVDGRKLATIVGSQFVGNTTYPTSASGTDTRSQWVGPSAYSTVE